MGGVAGRGAAREGTKAVREMSRAAIQRVRKKIPGNMNREIDLDQFTSPGSGRVQIAAREMQSAAKDVIRRGANNGLQALTRHSAKASDKMSGMQQGFRNQHILARQHVRNTAWKAVTLDHHSWVGHGWGEVEAGTAKQFKIIPKKLGKEAQKRANTPSDADIQVANLNLWNPSGMAQPSFEHQMQANALTNRMNQIGRHQIRGYGRRLAEMEELPETPSTVPADSNIIGPAMGI